MPRDWTQIAARFDGQVRTSAAGQDVTLYRPGRTIAAGVPTESNPAQVGTVPAIIIQGGNNPDQATLTGLSPEQTAEAHFLSTDIALVTEAAFLQDAGGLWWRIHSKPDIQRAGGDGTVLGIAALLVLQSQKPAGIP